MTQATLTRRVAVALAAVGSLLTTALGGGSAAHAAPGAPAGYPGQDDPVFRSYRNGRSGLCLAVEDPTLAHGSRIVQLPCTGGDEQYWFVTNNERDEHWAWRNKADETKCLSLAGGSQELGAQLVLENCDGSDHQLWGAWLDREGAYSITNLHAFSYRPGVQDGSTAIGAPIVQLWNGDRWPSPDDEPSPPAAR